MRDVRGTSRHAQPRAQRRRLIRTGTVDIATDHNIACVEFHQKPRSQMITARVGTAHAALQQAGYRIIDSVELIIVSPKFSQSPLILESILTFYECPDVCAEFNEGQDGV
jgi:hypothetical protein